MPQLIDRCSWVAGAILTLSVASLALQPAGSQTPERDSELHASASKPQGDKPDQEVVSACPSNDELDAVKQQIRDGHYEQAEKLARRLVDRTASGAGHGTAEDAEALRYLVEVLLREAKQRDPEVAGLVESSVELSQRAFGESHPCFAMSLSNRGLFSFRMDKFDAAKADWQRCRSIFENSFGAASPEVALILVKVASVEGVTGHFPEAGALMEQAVSIVNGLKVVDNPDLANIFHNYATYLDRTGDILGMVGAEERALEICERTLPTPHPQIAFALMGLGIGREALGDYASARALYERALSMTEETLGPYHRQVGQVLSNLALLMSNTGRPDLAIPYQERAMSISRAVLGEQSSVQTQELSEMGVYRARAGDWEGALKLLRAALAAQEQRFGPVHQEVAATLLRLANVEADSGDADSASRHYRRAVEIYQQMFGPSHPHISDALDGLAKVKLASGDFDTAAAMLHQVLAIREEALGPTHPRVAEAYVDLARVEWAKGDGPQALQHSLLAEGILRDHFGGVIRGFSEKEALAFQRIRATGLGVALSVLAGTSSSRISADSVAEVWGAVLRARAIVLDQVASRHEFAAEHRTGEPAALAKSLAAAANRLARMAVQGPDPQNSLGYRARFEKTMEEKERLEHDLAATAADSGGVSPGSNLSLESIREALPPQSGLVAFVKFPKSPGAAAVATPLTILAPHEPVIDEYGALMVTQEKPHAAFFDLGSVTSIDSLISRWRQETVPASSGRPLADSGSERDYRLAGAALRKKLWDPFLPRLSKLKHVLIVPEGNIALVSFAALPSADLKYLLETSPVLHYLSTERDLLKAPENHKNSPRALLMGGPDFDISPPFAAASLQPTAPVQEPDSSTVLAGYSYRGMTPGCEDFQTLRFGAIPGARDEVARIRDQILHSTSPGTGGKSEVATFQGSRASEPSFKQWAPGSDILHIATHAFFLGAGCDNLSLSGRKNVARVDDQVPLKGGGTFFENPLLLSGLALAGANNRSEASTDGDDGILTSEEIASMNLTGVRWVVLSACETGVGEIQSGEGVLGLRRAFQLAGARTIIMSLWKVDDQATLEWMQKLYEGRGEGLSTAEAVQRASLAMLNERRARGKSTHPFYWGAFVAAGDWR